MRRRAERGMALMYAALLLLAVAVVAAVAVDRSLRVRDATVLDRARAQALQAADGGLAHARVALAAGDGYSDERQLDVGIATVTVTVTPTGEDAWTVVSHATVPALPTVECATVTVVAQIVGGDGLPEVLAWDWR